MFTVDFLPNIFAYTVVVSKSGSTTLAFIDIFLLSGYIEFTL